jgi:hypothetical protein
MKNIILTIMVFTVMTLTTGCSDNGVSPEPQCPIKTDIPRWDIIPVIECMDIRSRYSTEEMRRIDSLVWIIDYETKIRKNSIILAKEEFNIERQKEIDGLKNIITDTVELERQIRIVNEKWDNSIEDYTNLEQHFMNIQYRNQLNSFEEEGLLRPEDLPNFRYYQETGRIPCCK